MRDQHVATTCVAQSEESGHMQRCRNKFFLLADVPLKSGHSRALRGKSSRPKCFQTGSGSLWTMDVTQPGQNSADFTDCNGGVKQFYSSFYLNGNAKCCPLAERLLVANAASFPFPLSVCFQPEFSLKPENLKDFLLSCDSEARLQVSPPLETRWVAIRDRTFSTVAVRFWDIFPSYICQVIPVVYF